MLLWIQTEPAFDFLHADPRNRALIQQHFSSGKLLK
jgi:hypothetical protein